MARVIEYLQGHLESQGYQVAELASVDNVSPNPEERDTFVALKPCFEDSELTTSGRAIKKIAHQSEEEAITTFCSVKGMSCASCVAAIETALGRVEGIVSSNVSLMANKATITHHPRMVGTPPFSAGYRRRNPLACLDMDHRLLPASFLISYR